MRVGEEEDGGLRSEHSGGAFSESRPVRRLGRGFRRRRRLRVGVTQLGYIALGVAAGLLVPRIHVGFTVPRPETVQMLFAVGAGLVTFIGVVFSLLFLVVQFGSVAFTPRLNLFYSSPIVWHAFGFYVGVLVYAFVTAFSMGGVDRVSGLVPIVTVVTLLAAIAFFRSLQLRAFRAIRLASTLAQVTERGHEVIDGVYPDRPAGEGRTVDEPHRLPDGRRDVVWSGRAGVLQAIDVPRIIDGARRADAVVEFVVAIGATVQRRTTVAVVHGTADPELNKTVLKAVRTGTERTFEQDPMLAFRVLVDIALRAISPGVNDPSTAAQALDSVEGLLRSLVGRDLDVGEVTAPQGSMRVLLILPAWEDYVSLAVDELIDMGASFAQVRRRLEHLLGDLIALASPARRPPLQARLERLQAGRSTAELKAAS